MELINTLRKAGLQVLTDEDLLSPEPVYTPLVYVGIQTNDYAKWLARRNSYVCLDGCVMERCVVANATEGFVEVYRLDANGHFIVDPVTLEAVTDIVSGKVEIVDSLNKLVHSKEGMNPYDPS